MLARFAASPEGFGLSSTNNQALQALCNALSTGGGGGWGVRDATAAPALAALVGRELASPRADCRLIAAGIAGNLALAWGRLPGAAGEAEAGESLHRGGLALASALLQGVDKEASGELVGRRLGAAAHLLARAPAFSGGDLGALLFSLDCVGGVERVAQDGARPAQARADAAAVMRLVSGL